MKEDTSNFPQKVYIPRDPECPQFPNIWWEKEPSDSDVEYIRADLVDSMLQMSLHPSKRNIKEEIFIEKACNILVNCIEDFMLRRMEIWDKECKKQTLENIRKKLLE